MPKVDLNMPYVKIPVLHGIMDGIIDQVAVLVSKPTDHTRLIICLVLQAPIGWFLNIFVTSPGTPRYLYTLITGFLL